MKRVQISLKLDPVKDKDIIDYLKLPGMKAQTVIKYMIREAIFIEGERSNESRTGRSKQGPSNSVSKTS